MRRAGPNFVVVFLGQVVTVTERSRDEPAPNESLFGILRAVKDYRG